MAVAFVSTPAATIKTAAASNSFASFSPVAGSGYLVVVSLETNQSGAAASTVAWASGGNGTWKKLKSFNFNQFQPTIEVWAVHCATAPGASVISVTGNAFVTSIHAPIREMTGHDTTLPTTGGTATSTSATGTISCTPNSTGGRIVTGALDHNEGFTATPNGSTTMLDSWNNSGSESYACFGTSNTTASTAQTLGVTNTLTANIQLALEILPAAGGSFTGTLARTQANNTAAASGVLGYAGTVATSQAANTAAASGVLGYAGTLARTQAANTASAAGTLGYTGTVTAAQAGNTAAASGTFTPAGITGSLVRTQANNAVSAVGTVHPTGTVAATQAANTAAAAGVLGYSGTLARIQAGNTAAAVGTFTPSGTSGSVSATQANNIAAAGGTVHPVGALAAVQANNTLTALGVLRYTGTLAKTQDGNTATAAGLFIVPIVGALSRVQADNTCAATGGPGVTPIVVTGTDRALTTVAGTDRPVSAAAGSDRPLTTVTGTDRATATVTST